MEEDARLEARLDRIGDLERSGAPPAALLAELRDLLRDVGERRPEQAPGAGEEVVGRRRTARAGDIIAM